MKFKGSSINFHFHSKLTQKYIIFYLFDLQLKYSEFLKIKYRERKKFYLFS